MAFSIVISELDQGRFSLQVFREMLETAYRHVWIPTVFSRTHGPLVLVVDFVLVRHSALLADGVHAVGVVHTLSAET